MKYEGPIQVPSTHGRSCTLPDDHDGYDGMTKANQSGASKIQRGWKTFSDLLAHIHILFFFPFPYFNAFAFYGGCFGYFESVSQPSFQKLHDRFATPLYSANPTRSGIFVCVCACGKGEEVQL